MTSDKSPIGRRHADVGPLEVWAERRQFQLDFLRRFGLAPVHRLLDLGCGTLRGGIPLIAYLQPGHYTGLESRTETLAEARQELAESGLTDRRPTLLHVVSLADIHLENRQDYIWAFSVMIHFTDAVLEDALSLVSRSLADGGMLLGNIIIGDGPDKLWRDTGLPVVERPWGFYTEACARWGLAIEDLGSRSDFGDSHGYSPDAGPDTRRMVRMVRA
ncbi:methyltransferase family protein [Hoeflea marina]|uniref:Methyltransferase family protein n=1 Tax=Hoeflea marina TaxID=274592 RepID=A0A317PIT3_9HYPH|nr:class I SAM-dependent methyltransferase [Hoeflea marina]PWW00234.1 methyltransferase family protein [Hoeflea marina]